GGVRRKSCAAKGDFRDISGSEMAGRTRLPHDFGFDFYTRRCRRTRSSDRLKTPRRSTPKHFCVTRVRARARRKNSHTAQPDRTQGDPKLLQAILWGFAVRAAG